MVETVLITGADEFLILIETNDQLPAELIGRLIYQVAIFAEGNLGAGGRLELIDVQRGSVIVRFRAVLQDAAAVAGVLGFIMALHGTMTSPESALGRTTQDLQTTPGVTEVALCWSNGANVETLKISGDEEDANWEYSAIQGDDYDRPSVIPMELNGELIRSLKTRRDLNRVFVSGVGRFLPKQKFHAQRFGTIKTVEGDTIDTVLTPATGLTVTPYERLARVEGVIDRLGGGFVIRVSSINLLDEE